MYQKLCHLYRWNKFSITDISLYLVVQEIFFRNIDLDQSLSKFNVFPYQRSDKCFVEPSFVYFKSKRDDSNLYDTNEICANTIVCRKKKWCLYKMKTKAKVIMPSSHRTQNTHLLDLPKIMIYFLNIIDIGTLNNN